MTEATIGLLLIGGAISMASAYPSVGSIIAGLLVIIALIKASKTGKPDAVAALDDQPQA